MDRKKFFTISIITLILILCITIGYSVITTTLSINGSSRINTVSWDIHFEDVKTNKNSTAVIKNRATIVNPLNIDYGIEMNLPGDFYEFTAVIVNNGSLDAKLASAPRFEGLDKEQEKMVIHSIKYLNGSDVETGDVLDHGQSRTIKVRVEFDKNYKFDDTLEDAIDTNFRYVMNFIQK